MVSSYLTGPLRSEGEALRDRIDAGDHVRDPSFGDGVVQSVDRESSTATALVEFACGTKAVKLAVLTKLHGEPQL